MIKGLIRMVLIVGIIAGLYQLFIHFPDQSILVIGITAVIVIIYWISKVAG